MRLFLILICLGLLWILIEYDSQHFIADRKDKKTYYTLDVALDSNFPYYHRTELSYKKYIPEVSPEYDTSTHLNTCRWDHLERGNYTIRCQTLFYREQSASVLLSSDTAFYMSNRLVFQPCKNFKLAQLFEADTIEFTYTSNGCFHGYVEKSLLTKKTNDSLYTLRTICYNGMPGQDSLLCCKQVPASIVSDLYLLQCRSEALKEKDKHESIHIWSTNHQDFYILSGQQVYQFSDEGLADWELYQGFREKYIN